MNGLEPLRLAACEFESHVSTNSTTSPNIDIIHTMNNGFYKKDYDFVLPDHLIAKFPPKNRGESKLLKVHGSDFNCDLVTNLVNFFNPNDLLVFNETKVFKARLKIFKESGGKAEILIIQKLTKNSGICLTKGINKKKKKQKVITRDFPIDIEILKIEENLVYIKFSQDLESLCSSQGEVPIPPYLNRDTTDIDNERYQSIFANNRFNNSVAAPTASLHFNDSLWNEIKERVDVANINLDIGYGTFQPLDDSIISANTKLHKETFFISNETQHKIYKCKEQGGRVIALGTTTLRALESAFDTKESTISTGHQSTEIFISEGYKFKVIDSLITNFHLPMSSLLMLVCAFGGKDNIMDAYNFAIKMKYKFFSYGDAMLIEKCLSK